MLTIEARQVGQIPNVLANRYSYIHHERINLPQLAQPTARPTICYPTSSKTAQLPFQPYRPFH